MQPILPVTPPDSRVWRVVHYPPVLLAIGLGLLFGTAALIQPLANAMPVQPGTLPACLVSLGVALAFAAAYGVFVRLVERRPRVAEFALPGAARELGAGLLIGLLLFSAVVAIIALFGGYRVLGTNPAAVMYQALALSIFSGVVEEIALRGLFFRLLERWLGSWIALALSAALFGTLHLSNPNATPFAALAIALEAGVMLGAAYMLTRRLWMAIGLHAMWNFAQGGIYGIAISGFNAPGLIRPLISGPEWLTGGAFGAEASIPALLVNLAFGAALLRLARERGRVVAPVWRRRQDAGLQE